MNFNDNYLTQTSQNQKGEINHERTKTRKPNEINFVLSGFRVFVVKKKYYNPNEDVINGVVLGFNFERYCVDFCKKR